MIKNKIEEITTTYKTKTNSKNYTIEELVDINMGELRNSWIISDTVDKFEEEVRRTTGAIVSPQQLKFAEDVAKLIFGKLKQPNVNIVVPARAGFGKSTVVKKSVKGLITGMVGDSKFPKEIKDIKHGAIIVSDKIENLKTYEDSIGKEFCCLISVGRTITIKEQILEQRKFPVVLITSQRFSDLEGNLEAFKTFSNGKEDIERELLIIDEKPQLLDSQKIDMKFIDEIGIKASEAKAGTKEAIAEKEELKILINEHIHNRFIDLTTEYKNKEVYIHVANDTGCLSKDDEYFFELCKKYLDFQTYSHILHFKRLVIEQGGLWYNKLRKDGNHRQYFRTLGAKDYSNNFKTIIFDATAAIDVEYCNNEKYLFLNVDDKREYDNVKIYNYPVPLGKSVLGSFNPSSIKKQLKTAEFINRMFIDCASNIFLVTYKDYVKILTDQLDRKVLDKIIKDKNREIPHFGNTKGQNYWSKCNTAIILGIYAKQEDEYTTMYLSHYIGVEKFFNRVKAEGVECALHDFFYNDKEKRFNMCELNELRQLQILVDFEQEVYRCSLRNFNNNEAINIYTFGLERTGFRRGEEFLGLDQDVKQRLGIKIEMQQTPEELDKTLNHGDGESIPATIKKWVLNIWDGTEIKTNDMLREIGITQKQFDKSKEKNIEMQLFMSKYMYKRGWYKKAV